MPVSSFALTNFRSYGQAEFSFGDHTTVVAGPNASGKTNLLEGLFVLASTKSFRAPDRDLVKHGQDHFRLVASAGELEVAMGYRNQDGHQEKRVTHNGSKKALSAHVGTVPAVLFEPSDLMIVFGPPERRRRYLDYILCQTNGQYLSILNQYKRVLKQRNRLLSNFDISGVKNQIFVWDLQLTEAAAYLYQERALLIDSINQEAATIYQEIAGDEKPLSLEYKASVTGEYQQSFMDALSKNLTADLGAGFTTIGPHREDFSICFGDTPIEAMASRGEVRTSVLVLKLAELSYIERASGKRPLLLLDDVFSELDHSRRRLLLQRLGGYQTIITTTEADAVSADLDDFHLIKTEAIHA
jgi:DNA replication and repair protein RecF